MNTSAEDKSRKWQRVAGRNGTIAVTSYHIELTEAITYRHGGHSIGILSQPRATLFIDVFT
ncbi:hypothetical protein C4J81_11170 [Deltaproteobacteria bacterium Smac51]|nr:hypothetical protein C4J81_11170 [Deltaproteobacteria bacterium Smac51]